MSDIPATAHPGTLSPRNVDTVHYRVIRTLPKDIAPVGGTFSAWAQGEVFACVSGIGLGPVKNSEIDEWEAAGLIERISGAAESPRRGAQRMGAGSSATRAPETSPSASESAGSRPWTLPGAVAAAAKA